LKDWPVARITARAAGDHDAMAHESPPPPARPSLSVFVSSPGDVAEERLIASRILARLADEYAAVARIEAIFWEHEPLLASDTFQAQIVRPSDTEIVICILWSRLGTRLPRTITRPDGSIYQSGTEFEFEDALEGHRRNGTPDLLVYRKMAEPMVSLRDLESARRAVEQRANLDAFVARFFHGTDGTLVAAFHPFDTSADFEARLEDHLRKLIQSRLQRQGIALEVRDDQAAPTWRHGCPFRGLNAFEFEHSQIFFGRTRAISDAVQQLKQHAAEGLAFLLVLGESGCGKSSLVRAGIMPLLMQPGVVERVRVVRRAIVRTGDRSGDLFDCLATALLRDEALPEIAGDGTTAASLADTLRTRPELAPLLVKSALARVATLDATAPASSAAGGLLVLFIDQLEELFATDALSDAERGRFFEVIRSLAASGHTWVIATLRSDFYHRVAEIPALVELKAGAGQYDLQPPDRSELAQLIRRPAFAAGLRFEEDLATGVRLDDLLRDAAEGDRSCLPLVQFTLEELYLARSGNVLTLAAYEAMGGIEGALSRRANTEFARLSAEAQAAMPSVFRHLVTMHGDATAIATRKAAPRSVFGPDGGRASAAREMVDAFIAARLFTAKRSDDGVPLVEVAHESLLTRWQPLVEWLRQDRELLQVRGRVTAAATRWGQEGRRRELLLQPGKPLTEGLQLLRADFPLTSLESEFVAASQKDSVHRQRMRGAAFVAMGILSIMAVAGGLIANGMRRRAVESEAVAVRAGDEARRTLVTLLLSNGDRLQSEGDTAGAALWYAKALPAIASHGAEAESLARVRLARVVGELARPARMSVLPTEDRRRTIRQAISPDGRSALANGASTQVIGIDAATGRRIWPPLEHEAFVTWAGWSSDGTRIVTLARNRAIRVWDATNGTPVTPSLTAAHDIPWFGTGASGRAELSPDNRSLAVTTTAGERYFVEVWDLSAGRPRFPSLEFSSPVAAVHFVPGGTTLLVATGEEVQFRDLDTGAMAGDPIRVPTLWDACPSHDGTRIATASGEGHAQVWDAATRTAVGAPLVHRGPVTKVVFSPDSARLVTLSADRTARLWSVSDGKAIGTPLDHPERPFAARFSPDGTRLTTVGFDHSVRLWDAAGGRLLAPPWRHPREPDAAPTPTGALIAAEGRLIHWDTSRTENQGAIRVAHRGSITRIEAAAAAPLLAACNKRDLWLLDASTGLTTAEPLTVDSDITSMAVSRDGRWIAVGCADGVVRLWTSAGERHDPARISHAGPVTRLVFTRAGDRLLTCSEDRTARLWNVALGEPATPPLEHPRAVTDGDVSPDGTLIVTATEEGTARLWSSASGHPVGPPHPLRRGEADQPLTHARFHPEGGAVLMAGARGDLLVWSILNPPAPDRPLQLGSGVSWAEFSPDGRRFAACGYGNAARVWEWRSPEAPVVSLPVATAAIQGAFHPQSPIVAITGFDGVRLWDCMTGRPLGGRVGAMAKSIAFAEDGRWLVALDEELRWSRVTPDEHSVEDLASLVRLLATREIDDGGALRFVSSEDLLSLFETLSTRMPATFQSEPGIAVTLGERARPR
jgi:WD40 repeat protein